MPTFNLIIYLFFLFTLYNTTSTLSSISVGEFLFLTFINQIPTKFFRFFLI